MKIYDISQEVFGCAVFPGDPQPQQIIIGSLSNGDDCNVSGFKMGAHNGTHIDAPYHFYDEGKKVDEVALERFVGYCYVTEHKGDITAEDAIKILNKAKKAEMEAEGAGHDASKRILVRGDVTMTEAAAQVFADEGILLYGNESQTVGPIEAPRQIHLIMLGAEIILLEGIRLSGVEDGIYLLDAAPLNLGGADGAPCRAILIRE